MHLLPCPHCHATLTVSPAQAGDTTACPSCQASVNIPKLGELRKLPLADVASEPDPRVRGEVAERSRLFQAGFGLAGLVATACLLVAGFCGIRWALTEVPATTDEHIATVREELSKRSAAELVREYEDMEKRGIDLGLPFKYKEIAMRKAKWGKDASIAAGIGAFALLAAVGFATGGRRKST